MVIVVNAALFALSIEWEDTAVAQVSAMSSIASICFTGNKPASIIPIPNIYHLIFQ